MTEDELRSVPLFEGLSDDAIRELSVWINEVRVPEGKHVVDEGDYSNELFVIMDGKAEVTRGDEHLADLGAGDFFGEIGVLGNERRNATVVAKSPLHVLTLAHYDVDRMRKKAPEMMAMNAVMIRTPLSTLPRCERLRSFSSARMAVMGSHADRTEMSGIRCKPGS